MREREKHLNVIGLVLGVLIMNAIRLIAEAFFTGVRH
jgi:hypothetical protein